MIEVRLQKHYQQQLALSNVIQESLGFWIPRCGLWNPGTGFRLSVAVRFRISIIRGIPNSWSRIVLPISVFELPYIGGNDSHKQTEKFKTIRFYGATHTIRQFLRYLLTYYCLTM